MPVVKMGIKQTLNRYLLRKKFNLGQTGLCSDHMFVSGDHWINNETEGWLNYPVISPVYLSHKHMKLYFQLFDSNFVTFLSFRKKFDLV